MFVFGLVSYDGVVEILWYLIWIVMVFSSGWDEEVVFFKKDLWLVFFVIGLFDIRKLIFDLYGYRLIF